MGLPFSRAAMGINYDFRFWPILLKNSSEICCCGG
jgi:hypothetical protein